MKYLLGLLLVLCATALIVEVEEIDLPVQKLDGSDVLGQMMRESMKEIDQLESEFFGSLRRQKRGLSRKPFGLRPFALRPLSKPVAPVLASPESFVNLIPATQSVSPSAFVPLQPTVDAELSTHSGEYVPDLLQIEGIGEGASAFELYVYKLCVPLHWRPWINRFFVDMKIFFADNSTFPLEVVTYEAAGVRNTVLAVPDFEGSVTIKNVAPMLDVAEIEAEGKVEIYLNTSAPITKMQFFISSAAAWVSVVPGQCSSEEQTTSGTPSWLTTVPTATYAPSTLPEGSVHSGTFTPYLVSDLQGVSQYRICVPFHWAPNTNEFEMFVNVSLSRVIRSMVVSCNGHIFHVENDFNTTSNRFNVELVGPTRNILAASDIARGHVQIDLFVASAAVPYIAQLELDSPSGYSVCTPSACTGGYSAGAYAGLRMPLVAVMALGFILFMILFIIIKLIVSCCRTCVKRKCQQKKHEGEEEEKVCKQNYVPLTTHTAFPVREAAPGHSPVFSVPPPPPLYVHQGNAQYFPSSTVQMYSNLNNL